MPPLPQPKDIAAALMSGALVALAIAAGHLFDALPRRRSRKEKP